MQQMATKKPYAKQGLLNNKACSEVALHPIWAVTFLQDWLGTTSNERQVNVANYNLNIHS